MPFFKDNGDPGFYEAHFAGLKSVTNTFNEGVDEIQTKEGRVKTFMRMTFRVPRMTSSARSGTITTVTMGKKVDKPFNVLRAHLDILKKIKEIDPTMTIVCKDKPNPISELAEDFPTSEEAFKQSFDVVDNEVLPNAGKTISVSHIMLSDRRLSDMKGDNTNGLMLYLKEHKITANADMHHGQRRAAVGILLKVHPRLFYRQEVHDDIKTAMEQVKLSPEMIDELKDDEVTRWFKMKPVETGEQLDMMEDAAFEIDWQIKHKVPQFEVLPRAAYAGVNQSKVQTDVLEIHSSERDHHFISLLLASASDQELLPYGEFIPRGGISSTAEKNQLRNAYIAQNKYISQCKSIYVKGLKPKILHNIYTKDSAGIEVTLFQYFIGTGYVQAIQRTNETTTNGKHVFITNADKINIVRSMIDTRLKELFTNVVPTSPECRYENHWQPTRTDAPRASTQSLTWSQKVLSQYTPETTATNTSDARTRKQKPPSQITYSLTDDKDFPSPVNAATQPSQKRQKMHPTSSDDTTLSPTATIAAFDLDKLDEIINKKLDLKLQKMTADISNSTQTAITALEKHTNSNLMDINHRLTKFENIFVKLMQRMNLLSPDDLTTITPTEGNGKTT